MTSGPEQTACRRRLLASTVPPLVASRGVSKLTKRDFQDAESAPAPDEARPAVVEHTTLLTFRIGALWLAVPAHLVEQVADFDQPTPVPRAPEYVIGLISLRGRAAA